MTRNIQAGEKLEDFINKLASLGYRISEVRKNLKSIPSMVNL